MASLRVTIFIMQWTYKIKLTALMAFHMLWGLVLWFSISKYGLGISTDSVHLLFAGLNLSEGRGLISFDGSPVLLWPPLYPALLALAHLLTGFDVFVSATILQVISFIGLSICLSLLFLKIFPENFLLAFAANVLSDTGVVVLIAFAMVGSDYIHLFLVLSFLLLTGHYMEHKSLHFLLAISAVGMLAMLQRYLGIAAIATGVVMVFFSMNGSLWQRMRRSTLVALSALPAGAWYWAASPLVSRRAPIGFVENFSWFSKSILGWFLPAQVDNAHLTFSVVYPWIFIGGLVILLFSFSRRTKALPPFATSLFVYATMYVIALFGSASITYFNKLGGRFLLPLYIPFVTLLVAAIDVALQCAREFASLAVRRILSTLLVGVLVTVAGGLLRISLPLVLQSHSDGAAGENAFNIRAWRENSALGYWLEHQPKGGYLLFSNYPDGIAFYTWHPTQASPRRFSGPYGKEEFPVAQYASQLFSPGLDVYLLWIEPNAYSYYYGVEDLTPIAQVQPLFLSGDGGVYRLRPNQPLGP
jgi:hypothetical protein